MSPAADIGAGGRLVGFWPETTVSVALPRMRAIVHLS